MLGVSIDASGGAAAGLVSIILLGSYRPRHQLSLCSAAELHSDSYASVVFIAGLWFMGSNDVCGRKWNLGKRFSVM